MRAQSLYHDQQRDSDGTIKGRALRKGDTIANSIAGSIDPTDPRRWTLLADPVQIEGVYHPQYVRTQYHGPILGTEGKPTEGTAIVDLYLSGFVIVGLGAMIIDPTHATSGVDVGSRDS